MFLDVFPGQLTVFFYVNEFAYHVYTVKTITYLYVALFVNLCAMTTL